MRLIVKDIVLYTSVWLFAFLGMLQTAVAKPKTDPDSLCKQPEYIEKILQQYSITNMVNEAFLACASLPSMSEQILIAYAGTQLEDDRPIDDYRLTFLTVNNQTQKVHSIYRVKELLPSDAIELHSIQLDLAPYQVSENLRAIGLRRNYAGRSSANPFSAQVLDLYDLKHKQKNLSGLMVERNQAETDTRCNAEGIESKTILVILKSTTRQYFDMQLRDNIQHYEMSGDLENCKETKRLSAQQEGVNSSV